MIRKFIEYVKKWDIIVEQISSGEIKQLADTLGKLVGNTGKQFERALLLRGAGTQPQVITVNKEGEDQPWNKPLFKQDNILVNYRLYFGPMMQSFTHSEILKLEFSNYEWILIMLGFDKDGTKMATLTTSPGLRHSGAMPTGMKILRGAGYKLFMQKDKKELHSSDDFIARLTQVVRDLSGRAYSAAKHQPEAKKDLDILKKEMPKEWIEYVHRKHEILGDNITAYRAINFHNSPITTINGQTKIINNIKPGEKFYYPNNVANIPYWFSQWFIAVPEEMDFEKQVASVRAGISGHGGVVIKANLPVPSNPQQLPAVLYTFNTLSSTASLQVNEFEICLEHSTVTGNEQAIICEIHA